MGMFLDMWFRYCGVGRQPRFSLRRSSIALAHLMSGPSFQALCSNERLTGIPKASRPMGIQMIGYPESYLAEI